MSHAKLKEILTRRLKLRDPHFRFHGRPRVSGSLVSSTFAGKRAHQRQQMIWDALEAELGPAATREVGMLLAYAPDEWALRLEGMVANGAGRQPRTRPHKKAG